MKAPTPLSNLQQRGRNRLGTKRRAMPRIDGKKGRPPGMVWRAPPPVANSRVNARMAPITVGNPLPEIGSPPYRAKNVGSIVGRKPAAFWKSCYFKAIGWLNGADSGNRTPDLLITNQLLYP